MLVGEMESEHVHIKKTSSGHFSSGMLHYCVLCHMEKTKQTNLGGKLLLGCKSVIMHMLIPSLCSLDSHYFNETTHRQMSILYVSLA